MSVTVFQPRPMRRGDAFSRSCSACSAARSPPASGRRRRHQRRDRRTDRRRNRQDPPAASLGIPQMKRTSRRVTGRVRDMRIRMFIGIVGVIAFGAFEHEFRLVAAAPVACESLRQVTLANGTILAAEPVQAVRSRLPLHPTRTRQTRSRTLPAFCRVTAKLTPSSDSDIRVEVWLPLDGWNRSCRASATAVSEGAFPTRRSPMRSGPATPPWARHRARRRQRRFRGRAPREAGGLRASRDPRDDVSAKTLVTAHYDARPARSYFNACSTGGRQALIEAQRYPEDFDGIVAGDPSWDQMRLYAARVYLNVYVNREPAAVIPPTQVPDDPCRGAERVRREGRSQGRRDRESTRMFVRLRGAHMQGRRCADCLTKPQVETAKAMSSPITDRRAARS